MQFIDEDLVDAAVTVKRLRLAGIEPTALVLPNADPNPRMTAERVFDLPIVRADVVKPGVIV